MAIPCEALVTKTEFEELKATLNKILGVGVDGLGQVDVITQQSLVGTDIEDKLLLASTAVQDFELATTYNIDLAQEWAEGRQQILMLKGKAQKTVNSAINRLSKMSGKANVSRLWRNGGNKIFGKVSGVAIIVSAAYAQYRKNVAVFQNIEQNANNIDGVERNINNDFASTIRILTRTNNDITQAKNEITTNEQRIAANKITALEIKDEITNLEANLTALETSQAQTAGEISLIKQEITDLETQYESFEEELSEISIQFKAELADYKVQLDNQQLLLFDLTEMIFQLREGFRILNERINDIDTRLTFLEGLVLPYFQEMADLEEAILDPIPEKRYKLRQTWSKTVLDDLTDFASSGGGGSAVANRGVPQSQNALLQLASQLAGEPISIGDITSGTIVNDSQKFKTELDRLIGLIDTTEVDIQPLLDQLRTDIKLDVTGIVENEVKAPIIPRLDTTIQQTTQPELIKAGGSALCNPAPTDPCSPSSVQEKTKDALDKLQDLLDENCCNETIAKLNEILNKLSNLDPSDSTVLDIVKDIQAKTNSTEYGLAASQAFRVTAWESTTKDKILNGLSTLFTLHNAVFLSGSASGTIAALLTEAYAQVGVTDYEGTILEANSNFGSVATALTNSLFNSSDLIAQTQMIAPFSRTYQTGANLLYQLFDLHAANSDNLKIVAQYLGELANQLRSDCVVSEDAWDLKIEDHANYSMLINLFEEAINGAANIPDEASGIDAVSTEVIPLNVKIGEILNARSVWIDDQNKILMDKEIELGQEKIDSSVKTEIVEGDLEKEGL